MLGSFIQMSSTLDGIDGIAGSVLIIHSFSLLVASASGCLAWVSSEHEHHRIVRFFYTATASTRVGV